MKGGRKDFVGIKFPQSSANWGIDIWGKGVILYRDISFVLSVCGHVLVPSVRWGDALVLVALIYSCESWQFQDSKMKKKNNILSKIINHVLNNCAHTSCAPLFVSVCVSVCACASNDLAIWVRDFWNTWCDSRLRSLSGFSLSLSPPLSLSLYMFFFGS